MKAKRKELKKLSLDEVGGAEAKTTVVKQEIQVRERRQHMIEGDAAEAARELARSCCGMRRKFYKQLSISGS